MNYYKFCKSYYLLKHYKILKLKITQSTKYGKELKEAVKYGYYIVLNLYWFKGFSIGVRVIGVGGGKMCASWD
jgi:hypothetical protein